MAASSGAMSVEASEASDLDTVVLPILDPRPDLTSTVAAASYVNFQVAKAVFDKMCPRYRHSYFLTPRCVGFLLLEGRLSGCGQGEFCEFRHAVSKIIIQQLLHSLKKYLHYFLKYWLFNFACEYALLGVIFNTKSVHLKI